MFGRHAGIHRNADPLYVFPNRRIVKHLVQGVPLRTSAMRTLGADLLSKRVSEVMTIDVITCVTEDRAAGIMELMVSKHLRHIPVLEDDKLINMVSIRDLLQLRLDELDAEARAMRDYISGPPNPLQAVS